MKEAGRHSLFATLIMFLLLVNTSLSNHAQPYEGYTLYFPQNGTKAYLIDLSGNTFHSWTFASNFKTCYSTYLLPGGVLLRTVSKPGNFFTGGPISGEVQKVDWNGNILWDFVYSTQQYCSHHDIHPMPDGNVLLIAYERKSPAEVTAAGCSQSIEMWPDKIVEIEPSGPNGGTVVWEWHVWDHLVQDHDPTKNNYGIVANHPELININYQTSKDWMHVNGIDYNEELDQIVFSSHTLNELYVIDHSTTTAQAASHTGGNSGKGGDILYRWGNPAAYQTPGNTYFNVVHDAHWVPQDTPLFPNALSAYNNRGGPGGKTCTDIINPPYNGYNYFLAPGTAYEPPIYDWRHVYSGNFSSNNGNSQQLPNGNTLMCIGMSGLIYEIDSNQNQVWSKTTGAQLPQAFRYPPCYVTGIYSASAIAYPADVCPDEPVQLNVAVTGGVAYTYSWNSIPPGFTSAEQNPVVYPSVTTIYVVTVTNGPCSDTDSVTVTVHPVPPTPVITQSGDTLYSSSNSGNQWYLDGSQIPGATAPYHVPVLAGAYQVGVTSSAGCQSLLSSPYLVTWIIHQIPPESLRLFPNPVRGVFTLDGIWTSGRFGISIFDSEGKLIFTGKDTRTVDLHGKKSGIYYLLFVSENNELAGIRFILIP